MDGQRTGLFKGPGHGCCEVGQPDLHSGDAREAKVQTDAGLWAHDRAWYSGALTAQGCDAGSLRHQCGQREGAASLSSPSHLLCSLSRYHDLELPLTTSETWTRAARSRGRGVVRGCQF